MLIPGDRRYLYVLRRARASGARTLLSVTDATLTFTSACGLDSSSVGIRQLAPALVFDQTDASNTSAAVRVFADMVQQYKPDVVLCCTNFVGGSAVLHNLRDRDLHAKLYVTSGLITDSRFASDATLRSSGIVDVSTWAPFGSSVSNALTLDFTCRTLSPFGCLNGFVFDTLYTARFNTSASLENAAVFGALEVFTQSVVAAGSLELEAVLAAVTGHRFTTALGEVQFGYTMHMGTTDPVMRQLVDGRVEYVSPPEYATANLLYPVPTWALQRCQQSAACGSHGACNNEGGCECSFGWVGSSCQHAVGHPLLALAGLLVLAALAGLGRYLHTARRSRLELMEAARRAKEREAMEEVSRRVHVRTLSYASHELANPLFAIMATSEELTRATMSSHRAATYILRASHQMERVLQDMALSCMVDSDLSDETLHALPMEYTPTSILAVFRDVRHRMQHLHSLQMVMNFTGSIPERVLLDGLRLHQLLA
ncbi:hypothetical protein EON66_05740 [archaeon]|nr:MAG: hypothetical protein EON66_05740 [archaeon]